MSALPRAMWRRISITIWFWGFMGMDCPSLNYIVDKAMQEERSK